MSSGIFTNLQLEDATEEIRLIKLQPCEDPDAPANVHLFKAVLREKPRYEALSYACGTSMSGKHVQVDGARFDVGDNLDLALRRIRHGSIERTIWVDAICINQNDLKERGCQVSIMARVFGQAERVLCWLGLGNGFEQGLSSLNTTRLLSSTSLYTHEAGPIADEFVETLSNNDCSAIEDMAAKPYWKRVWIIQEIVLAKAITVIYGKVELPWDFIESLDILSDIKLKLDIFAFDNPKYLSVFNLNMSTDTIVRARKAAMSGVRSNILELLHDARESRATDDRDKIFALYGLIPYDNHFVPVDYTKQTEEIFQCFARTHITSTQSLSVLLYAPGRKAGELKLPSWVPDWTRTARGLSLRHDLYDASRGLEYVPDIEWTQASDNVLTVRGVVCDRVSMFKSVQIGQGSRQHRWGLEEILFSKGPCEYPSGIPRLQALFRCSVADRYRPTTTRLDDNPNFWLQRLLVGFCLDLGSQADPESYPHHAASLDANDLSMDQTGSKMYIAAYKEWAKRCSHLLNDAMSNAYQSTHMFEGPFVTPRLSDRVIERSDELSVLHRLQCSNPSPDWPKALGKARDCTSDQEIMELLLGRMGDPATIEWPSAGFPISHQKLYWDLYYLSANTIIGAEGVYFGTSRGYVGLCESPIQAGDLVCVLSGCPTPVILRSSGSQFSFVGVCYVEGLMDGQAMEMVHAGQLADQVMQLI